MIHSEDLDSLKNYSEIKLELIFRYFFRKPDDEEMAPQIIRRVIERDSVRASMRASLRGEEFRSSMIQRSSVRSRRSFNSPIEIARL